ncbi:hypothetical protein vseg_010133 [Gypsophila vaccaria]
MPTPVTAARQCLTDEAARALDDAVSVAKRRNHAQTTSLHAISALLSPSFNLLRESLSRVRSSAYSPRLQLRALDLCVSVSLDRLPSYKPPTSSDSNDDFAPPVSNSLMAAIKRSQAHQRRQPDTCHLTQLHHSNSFSNSNSNGNGIVNNNNNNNNNNSLTMSCVRVEMKHLVLSILDDPIVSRVFGEAGFRSSDIKLAIVHPPRWGPPTRRPPMFLCNFMDFTAGGGDENCRRIGEVMARSRERNPVLVGACARDALAKFAEKISSQVYTGLPRELHGARLACVCLEVGGEESFSKVRTTLENEPRVRFVINLGDLRSLVKDKGNEEGVNKVSELVEEWGKRVCLISEVANYETYTEFIGRFSSVERLWDLQPLPITVSSSGTGSGSGSRNFEPKSSLMGSFVPFGGFFPTPSDFRAPITAMRASFTRCSECNESYERELRAIPREGSSVSVTGNQSLSFPPWLQRTEADPSKAGDVVTQVKDVTCEKISSLQKKWDDHCLVAHQKYPFSAAPVSIAGLQVAQPLGFQLMANIQDSLSSSGDSSANERACSNSSSTAQILAQRISPQKQVMRPDFPKIALETSVCHLSPRTSSGTVMHPIPSLSPHQIHKPVPTVPVTTDLGLGMIYESKSERHSNPFPFSLPSSHGVIRKESGQIEGPDLGDYKPLLRKLSEMVSWQGEAICRISEIVSRCKSGNRHHQRTNNTRGNIWLSFLGPDKIGQKRVAQALANAIHGSEDRLIAFNVSCQEKTMMSDSLFLCQGLTKTDINARITVVDHIAQELCRKPQSVVFLENIDEADPLVQNSLIRAVQSGKFPDSRGKEVAISNVVFVMTCRVAKDETNQSPRKEFIKFREDKIVEAKNWDMQLAVRSVSGSDYKSKEMSVSLLPPKCASAKRKLSDLSDTSDGLDESKQVNKMTKKSLDLNLPLDMDCHDSDPIYDYSKVWLEEFFSKVDGNVTFKPFDFDALADSLLRKIRLKVEETLKGQRILLEIDHEVMLQILAAAWYADTKGAVEDWIDHVLGPYLSEARERYHLNEESVVRLCSCEGVHVKDWASGILLPRRINMSI